MNVVRPTKLPSASVIFSMVTVLFRHRTHYYDKMRTAGKVGEGGQSKNVDFSPISPQLLAFLSDLLEQD